jgi:segregation and condensation protein A
MLQLPSEFRAALESYRGPLDLLLYLIKRDEIDIFDIPIARIVEQYQIYLEVLGQVISPSGPPEGNVDPNACGEFLVMAANLMEIKSKLLLPRESLGEDEDLEDPRIELVRQLLEYKKYKERAMLLDRRIEEHSHRYERPTLPLGQGRFEPIGAVSLGNVSVWDLLTAFHRIQIALGQREPHRVILQDRPIEEYIAAVEELLSRAPSGKALFDDLFTDVRSRHEAIGFLLALLEMAKECRLSFYQEELFGPIEIRLHDEAETRELLARAREVEGAADPAEHFLLEGEGHQAAAEPIAEPIAEPPVPGAPSGAAGERGAAPPPADGSS